MLRREEGYAEKIDRYSLPGKCPRENYFDVGEVSIKGGVEGLRHSPLQKVGFKPWKGDGARDVKQKERNR